MEQHLCKLFDPGKAFEANQHCQWLQAAQAPALNHIGYQLPRLGYSLLAANLETIKISWDVINFTKEKQHVWVSPLKQIHTHAVWLVMLEGLNGIQGVRICSTIRSGDEPRIPGLKYHVLCIWWYYHVLFCIISIYIHISIIFHLRHLRFNSFGVSNTLW